MNENRNVPVDSNKVKQSFESFIVEFKEKRESVISILKIVIHQQKGEEFVKFLKKKQLENYENMKEFMKSKYYEFVGSLQNIQECKDLVRISDDNLTSLSDNIQSFLSDFSVNFIDKINKREEMMDLRKEKEKLNISYILFGYLNKATQTLKDQQFYSTIRLINQASTVYLKKLPNNSVVFKYSELIINRLKQKITNIIEDKLFNWLVEVIKEQNKIGETIFRKLKFEREKNLNKTSSNNKNNNYNSQNKFHPHNTELNSIGNKNSIVDNLLIIKNTSNLNYMMNKNSLLKSSVLNQTEFYEEFDIINMVSNVNLNFLEQAYYIYQKVDNDTKFIDYFVQFRQTELQNLIKMQDKAEKIMKTNKNVYEVYFSEILGFIIVQIAVYELLPMFYTKRKFEENMNYLLKELHSNLSFEFDSLVYPDDFVTLENNIFIFLNSLEKIGINERIGLDMKSTLLEIMKDKVKLLNYNLIRKYNNFFVNLLFEEKCLNIEIKSEDEFIKYASQYAITLDDNSKPISGLIYPYKLPYTDFVIKVNENFKKYVDEIYHYIEPLYNDYENIMHDVVRDFIKKINEVFHTFSNFQEHDLNIILAAQICNNIRFIFKSHNFYSEYVMKKCNIRNVISFDTERAFRESCQNYEEIIYENLKKKFKHFISDLYGENWLPEKPNTQPNMYIQGMLAYISTIYVSLQMLSPFYIEFCFKEAMRFISKIYMDDILFNSNVVISYNINAMENLKLDIEALDMYAKNISHTHPGFEDGLLQIKNILNLFFTKKVESFITVNKNIDVFYQVKYESLIKFLMRYKNLNKSSDMKGKLTESEVSTIIKKLKDLKI